MCLRNARFLSFVVTVCLFAHTGGSNAQIATDDSSHDESITSFLITDTAVNNKEAWICLDQKGEPSAYLFYDLGVVDVSDEVHFGSEYSIRKNVPAFHCI